MVEENILASVFLNDIFIIFYYEIEEFMRKWLFQ